MTGTNKFKMKLFKVNHYIINQSRTIWIEQKE